MKRGWLLPTGLIVLSFVPILGGALRLTELSAGAVATAENARFVTMPAPVVVHIVGASVYCVLGAFQFAPAFRRRRPGWHRASGRVLVVAGLATALSGIWMTLFYRLPAHDGPLLNAFRLVFASAMAASIVLAFRAIRRRDVATHRAWMIRAYAIAQGAGTQAILLGFGGTLFSRTALMGAAWVVNLAVAEAVIRRRPAHQRMEVAA